ncbi:MAG: outer membrane beta-barrel protein [Thermonemataceae bacterium]|nr:outer membrane beta-barrel protein [Thermonemataceae bacterium]
MNLRYLHLWLLLFFWGVSEIKAQTQDSTAVNDCSLKLQEGETAYEDGSLSISINLLEECLKTDGFNEEEKQRALRLLTIIYLYKNQEEDANKYMQQLLKANPEYRLRPNDPNEFVQLYKEYKIRPYLIVGGGAGANLPMLSIGKLYSTDNPNSQAMVYNSLVGFQIAANVSRPLTNKVEVIFAPTFTVLRYRFEANYFEYASLTFEESQRRLDLPLLFKYNFRNKYNFSLTGIKPYVFVGGVANLILSSLGDAQRQDVVSEDQSRSVEGKAIEMTELRNKTTFSALAGVGAEYKIGLGHLYIEFRYQHAFMNMINEKNRFLLQSEIAKYGYIDNDYKMGSMSVYAGYNYPLYNPKKRKRKSKEMSEEIKIENN